MSISIGGDGSRADASVDGLPVELGVAWAETARVLWSSRSSVATLQRIVDGVVSYVDACDAASVSMCHGETVDTPAWSDPVAAEIDTIQYATAEGPCLDAIAKEGVVYVEDLRHDPRWPAFGPRAADRGMHSLLSLRLGADAALGSLNLYARDVGAYELEERTKALVFAGHACVAVAAAREIEQLERKLAAERRRFNGLQRALPSHGLVALAEGILMDAERISRAQAFAALRRTAMQTGKHIADVAAYVARNRRLPKMARSRVDV